MQIMAMIRFRQIIKYALNFTQVGWSRGPESYDPEMLESAQTVENGVPYRSQVFVTCSLVAGGLPAGMDLAVWLAAANWLAAVRYSAT